VLTISHDALDCLDIDQAAPVFLAERMVQSAELINKSGRTMARSWLSKSGWAWCSCRRRSVPRCGDAGGDNSGCLVHPTATTRSAIL